MKKALMIVAMVGVIAMANSAMADSLITPGGIWVSSSRGDEGWAIDSNLGSWSYLTPGGTIGTQTVALDLGASRTVDAIRVAKWGDCDATGAGSPGLGDIDSMDLRILYTADTGALGTRSYSIVSGLSNDATEPIVTGLSGGSAGPSGVFAATATVGNDNHDYATNGHYRLNFDAVDATAVAIEFAKDAADVHPFSHYRTFEFQVNEQPPPPPLPNLFTPSALQVFRVDTGADNTRAGAADAIDGNTGTWNFLTPSNTEGAQIVALDLGGSRLVDAIRVAKIGDTDGGGGDPIDNMDLQILFTTDTGELRLRSYSAVSGLASSAIEPITADAVNSAGATVDNDRHDFGTDGWYTLEFDAVNATAIAIRFARDPGDPRTWTHYPTYEFELNEAVPIPEPGGLGLIGLALLAVRKTRS